MMLFCKRNPKIVFGALAGIVISIIPRIVFSQDIAPVIESSGPWWVTALVAVVILFSGAIGTLLVTGVRKGMKWLDERIANEYLSGVIQRATPVLEQLVDKYYKTAVKPLKASGKWNEKTQNETKEAVLADFGILWGAEGAKTLAHVLGAPETATEWLGGLVERAVTTRKTAGRRAKALKAANPSKG